MQVQYLIAQILSVQTNIRIYSNIQIFSIIHIRSTEECHYQHRNPPKDTLYELYLPENLKSHQFCAGSIDDNVRTSFGDSGGPAFRRFVHFVFIMHKLPKNHG